jgi:hypothetical protein
LATTLACLGLLGGAAARAQDTGTPADDPDGLKPLTKNWQDRRAQTDGSAPAQDGTTLRRNVGELVILALPADKLAGRGPAAWDIPATLARKGEYYEDAANNTVVLPSPRPGTYTVYAWASPLQAAVLPFPYVPPTLSLPGKPERIATYTVVIGGAATPVKPDQDGGQKPTVQPGNLAAAYALDVKNAGGTLDQVKTLAASLRSRAATMDQVKTVEDIYAPLMQPGDRVLPKTRAAIVVRLRDRLKLDFPVRPNDRQKAIFKQALEDAANALDQLK